MNLEFLVGLLIWFIVFLFSLSFHESAHAWTSERFGDYTGRQLGRVSLNPLSHIDPIGTVVFPLMGMLSPGIAMFGWAKPVPVNPLLWKEKDKANIMVSAAGPISNFILAVVAFFILKMLLINGLVFPVYTYDRFNLVAPANPDSAILGPLSTFLSVMLTLNVTLGVFNLIPIPPLDGSHVLESTLPAEMAKAYEQIEPYGFILLIGLMLTGVFGMILRPILIFVLELLFGV